ncbi:hypothetical protein BN1002_04775 [Bacillus sp. B-jedd]|nr:hypothetical protein BN1002_04775 [Bacillus sp. B-jedd]
MQSELGKWAAKNSHKINSDKKEKLEGSKRKEKLSTREIKDLMGTFQPTYKRSKGGAIRQR